MNHEAIERLKARKVNFATTVPISIADARAVVVEWAKKDISNINMLFSQIGFDACVSMLVERRFDMGKPMPTNIVAAQCSLFDNWGSTKRPSRRGAKEPHSYYKERYAVQFTLWDSSVKMEKLNSSVNSAFVGTSDLLSPSELHEWFNRDRKAFPKIRERYGDEWRAFCDTFQARDDRYLYGVVRSVSQKQTKYHENHYVMVEQSKVGQPDMKVTVVHEGVGEYIFDKFHGSYANGKPLQGACVRFCALSERIGSIDSKWTTG